MTVLDVIGRSDDVRRLGSVVDRVQEIGYPDSPPLSVFLDAGVVPRADRSDNHNQLGSDLAKYQRVLPGDLVFNRLRTWQGGFGASAHEGIVSPAYVVARPRDGDARYLDYVLHSAPYLAELTRVSKWMPPSQFDILWEDLRGVRVPWLPVREQRRIADFLDDRVSRIDRIIAARREQVSLLDEQLSSRMAERLSGLPRIPVRRGAREVLVGIVIQPARLYTDEPDGVPALRGVNVGEGRFSTEDLVAITPSGHAANPRSRLSTGDVVIVRTGDAGAAAVIRPDMDNWNCIDLVIVRCGPNLIPDFVSWMFNAARRDTAVASESAGSIQQHFGVGAVAAYPIPWVSLEDQHQIVESLERAVGYCRGGQSHLHRSIDLLAEYKSSLITAAVTGELDVTTAGSTIPE